MDDFGMFSKEFGLKPPGKSAPMKGGIGSDGGDRRARSSSTTASPFVGDQNNDLFTDVFGGPPKYGSQGSKPSSMPDFDYDSIFKGSATNETKSKSTATSSGPVYDKPVYDDDIFDGLPGLKSKSVSSARFEENVFASMASPPKSDHFDDYLGNLGRNKSSRGFDDLLPGFGSGKPTVSNRATSESKQPSKPSGSSKQRTSDAVDDPFVILESTSTTGVSSTGLFNDPLEEISKLGKSGNDANTPSASGGIFSDIDPLEGLGKTIPVFPSEIDRKGADGSSSRPGSSVGSTQNSTAKESYAKHSSKYTESHSQKKIPVEDVQDSRKNLFDMPTASIDSPKEPKLFDETVYSHSFVNGNGSNSQADMSPKSEQYMEQSEDVWLYVSEVPLFTQPTNAPPPSRPPPPIPGRKSRSESARKKGNEFSSSENSSRYSQSRNPFVQEPKASSIDELEAFAMGNNSTQNANENAYGQSDAAASAAAMKEAMDRAEAKFRHAKEVREREYTKAGRTKESVQPEKGEEQTEGEFRANHDILEKRQREEEERERELKRLEKERAARAREIEREKARQAVERATREARERAAAEARERANAENRLKSERAAVQRAQAEARERAAADARGRAERAASEARERSSAEAREKEARDRASVARAEAESRRRAERAAVDKVAAEARQRAAADARDRAAAAARMNQQKDDNDLESFFSSRASSVPRPRSTTSEPVSDPQFQSRGGPEVAKRASSSGIPSNMRKASSTTNMDDLTSLFGAASSSGGFPDIDGETEERRRARLERHQRTQERAAKALAEKNQRDLQVQKDQEERHRISETLDTEIKRWAAGKEGNLRALLSTLQYVLWPECGWQPVSLTDLITGASVKKAYRKATLCIHPDKVQQKGANLQQKYVAEKVFDLLKEAWNKFNSEELF